MKSSRFSNQEIEILTKLRSRTLELKSNFKKKYNNNLKCSIKDCYSEESQEHLLFECKPILSMGKIKVKVTYKDIKNKIMQLNYITVRLAYISGNSIAY